MKYYCLTLLLLFPCCTLLFELQAWVYAIVLIYMIVVVMLIKHARVCRMYRRYFKNILNKLER